jgi:hypothetical protein
VDEQGLHDFASLSPQEYFQMASQTEERGLAELAQSLPFQQKSLASYNAEIRLRPALEGFSQVGIQLYGVRLSPENLAVVPSMDVNAFPTGSRVFLNEGLIHYFLKPADYVAGIVSAQSGELTSEQYSWLQSNFAWQDDWNSIYFVLAHEAAHNLMRHRDEGVLERVRTMFDDYRQVVLDYRKDVAHGRKGGGVKRYVWHSLQNFAEEFQSAEQQRAKEAEADAVALLLLQGSGYNPAIALVAGQKMAMLLSSGDAGGRQGAMTEVLCSTHPDWMVRIQNLQMNLNCLQFKGNLCENHIAYPVDGFLPQLREGMALLDKYHEETLKIAEASPSSSDQVFEAEVKVEPKDAQLRVDGQPMSPGTLRLPVGPHALYVAKDGYSSQELRIVVFPDVKLKVKIKLKRLTKRIGDPPISSSLFNGYASCSTAATIWRAEMPKASSSSSGLPECGTPLTASRRTLFRAMPLVVRALSTASPSPPSG